MSKKPRKNKMDARKVEVPGQKGPRKEKDWGFEDIARSKTRRR